MRVVVTILLIWCGAGLVLYVADLSRRGIAWVRSKTGQSTGFVPPLSAGKRLSVLIWCLFAGPVAAFAGTKIWRVAPTDHW
jgi:hypothetical protein